MVENTGHQLFLLFPTAFSTALIETQDFVVKGYRMLTLYDLSCRPENVPWLYYFTDAGQRIDGNDVLRDTYLQTQYTFDPESKIEYRVARYSLDGEYIGLNNVENGRIQLCADTTKRLNAAYVFGTTYKQSVS